MCLLHFSPIWLIGLMFVALLYDTKHLMFALKKPGFSTIRQIFQQNEPPFSA